MIRIALALFSASLALSSPVAMAKNYAPPGRAGTSQYAEDIPSGGGNVQTPAMNGGNHSPAEIDSVGSGKVGVHRLAKLGKTGLAAAQFAQQTAPTLTGSLQPIGGHSGAARAVELSATGDSALGGLGHVLSGSDIDGIGVFLPLLFVFGLGWVAAIAFSRARGRAADDGSQP